MRIAITAGEPAGIGPDLVIQIAQQAQPVKLVCIADSELLQQRAQRLGLPLKIIPFDHESTAGQHQPGTLTVWHQALQTPAIAGQLDVNNARYVLNCLDRAIEGCRQGQFAALVTGPVHKGIINEAGIPFTGHTEYLAEKTATDKVVMMLAAPGLRVALATTHLPLYQVSQAITRDELQQVIQILHHDLVHDFGISRPHILVCGLNPHAGEDGHLGREEIDIITPVLDACRAQGMDLQGPLPADTLFTPRYLEKADAVLAMYHDQGLPVLKHMGFGQAVNITLGLPIIRTSVDHGTALELAGSGKAETGSLMAAIETAMNMAQSQNKTQH